MGAGASAGGGSETTGSTAGHGKGLFSRLRFRSAASDTTSLPPDSLDDIDRLSEGDDDIDKLRAAFRKSQDQNRVLGEKLDDSESRNKELIQKLQEMMAAIRLLKAENVEVTKAKDQAEAHLAQMANPEREAYMHKYALEKLQEEFEKYKVDVAAKETKLRQELRRMQENLANRSAADEAAKAALQAEIRELRAERGNLLTRRAEVKREEEQPEEGGEENKAQASAQEEKAKSEEALLAANIEIKMKDEVNDVAVEAKARKREVMLRKGKEFLKGQGVIAEQDDEFEEKEEVQEKPKIIDFAFNRDVANLQFNNENYLRFMVEEPEDGSLEDGVVDVCSKELVCQKHHLDSFGTHAVDAYGTEPFIARQDALDLVVEFAQTSKQGSLILLGRHGVGKSFVLAAAAKQIQLEDPETIVCSLFVGATSGSRDTRILLQTLCMMLSKFSIAKKFHKIPDAIEDVKEYISEIISHLVEQGRPPVIIIDAVSEVQDLYSPPLLEWLPLLLRESISIMSLLENQELQVISSKVQLGYVIELDVFDGEQKIALFRHLVTKHNTAVTVELNRQKEAMRQKAMAELQRLKDERMQRRLQREKIRGPSKRKKKSKKEKQHAEKTQPELKGENEEEQEEQGDPGLLGVYETEAVLEKPDSGLAIYLVMAVEYLLSLERKLPALEEATMLPGTFEGLIDHVLDQLENKHGKELVRNSMMLLALARYGLSQAELLQLLLSSPQYRACVEEHIDLDSESFLCLRKAADWLRYLRDLAPLLRPRGHYDIRAQDLRLRHEGIRVELMRRYCTHKCFWHRATSVAEVHKTLADFYGHEINKDKPNELANARGSVMERWLHAEKLWQFVHSTQDLIYHRILAKDWKLVEILLTSLKFIETKSRAADPYHLLTDFSAALDATHFIYSEDDDDSIPTLSFLQRIRIGDFQKFVNTFADIFKLHPELVIQQGANMPDESSVAVEALRIVSNEQVEVAWFKFLNKSQLGDPCIMTLKCNGPIECVAYSPDGRQIVTASTDGFGGKISVWDSRSGLEVGGFATPAIPKSVCYSGDGRLLLAVSAEGTVVLCDMMGLKERAREVLGSTFISEGALSIDGKKMVLVSSDGLINLWDLPQLANPSGLIYNRYEKMFEIVDEDEEGRPSPITCVSISPNVNRVVTGMKGGTMKVFDLSMTDGLSVKHVLQGHSSVVAHIGFNDEGNRICSASLDHTMKVWDVERGGTFISNYDDRAEIRACNFSPDGSFVAVGLDSGRIDLVDISTAMSVMSFGSHSGRVNDVMFDHQGKFLISGSMDGLCKVWAIQDTDTAETFTGHPKSEVTCASYSSDGTELATGAGDGSIKLWGGRRGREIMSFQGHDDRVTSCAFSPLVGDRKSGILTTSMYDGTVRLWKNLTGSEDEEFRHNSTYLTCIAFSPEQPPDERAGRVLAGSFDGSAIIWDIESKKLLLKLGVEIEGTGGWRVEKIRDRHEDAVVSCCFHPAMGSERAITTSLDGTAKIWNTQWGNCLATLEGHAQAVNGCCYSKDGQQVYTVSSDQTVREWMAGAPYTCLTVIRGHYGPIHQCSFATSGKHLFTVSEDRSVRAWLKVKLEPEEFNPDERVRVGSQHFAVSKSHMQGEISEFFQWHQVALFASTHALRCVAGSTGEDNEEIACGGADGSVFVLRLMLPGDY